MTRDEFIKNYEDLARKAIGMSDKSRREGLLALENIIDPEKVKERDIFEYGIRFVVDGVDSAIINNILTNIIAQEKDEYTRKFKEIQKEAVLQIQSGVNYRILFAVINSFTDLSHTDETIKIFTEDLKEPDL